jgi:DNA-binding HxlR family transcriptional regulator
VGVIQPEFLAQLRQRCRAELVLVLVQLEQLCPAFWPDLTELAEQLGTDRSTLNRSLRKLEDQQLLRRVSISNGGGTWVWWVARYQGDQPLANAEPAWVLRDLRTRKPHRVTVTRRWDWARRYGIPRSTMRNFLTGGQMVMRERWELVATPYDEAAA